MSARELSVGGPMMQQVIFIADDFGRDAPTNNAIREGHLNGALHGASLMLGQPGTEQAIEIARDHPGLRLGWHIHLCDSTPATFGSWPWGRSPLMAGLLLAFFGRRIRAEMSAQWNLFEMSGIPCSFVNSHHHIHAHPAVLQAIGALLPASFGGWLRGFNVRPFSRRLPAHARVLRLVGTRALARSPLPMRCSDTTWGLDRLCAMDALEIEAVLPTLGQGLHEFIFHPRGTDDDADFGALINLRGRVGSAPHPKRG
ncbi:MAG TPA: ChbG/HpnK family deacetylase [Verrucomicrobiae bacterium]|nr:ChbG/HpnK family deacetylase [Verrucomicrobiae bacterium]